jgi:phosphopantothenoylcysteine decarboxylase/phosphopantothenate--cysteine ligase
MLGVCGSIAAYKAVELVRLMQQHGIVVDVAMTKAATRFITPLTFAALTGRDVYTSLWEGRRDSTRSFSIEHIAAVEDADALVIAPATANILAKFAHGLADDFLTAAYLATKSRVHIAPAMNVNMWNHPATQQNVRLLTERGAHFINPDSGYLACGMTGDGRLAAPEKILAELLAVHDRSHDLAQETIVITAGGTREPIDPVRFIGNRSSGRMGHALAEAAISRGARVILITASTLPVPATCTVVRVHTAAQMYEAVVHHLPQATVVIKAAAVSDFRPQAVSPSKLRRTGTMLLELQPTEDIVAKVVERRCRGTLVIAFAAETENIEANAGAKLLRKGVDAIVANDVSRNGLGFESLRNAGIWIDAERTIELPESSKKEMADRILTEISGLRTISSQLR